MTTLSREQLVELEKAIYETDPLYEGCEYVDGLPVTPGGYLSWSQMVEMEGSCIHVDGHLKVVRKQALAALSVIDPAAIRRQAFEEAAKEAEDAGCGRAGCDDCIGGRLANYFRALAQQPTPTKQD